MKNLILILLILSSTIVYAKEPKFSKEDRVRYEVPTFYKNICDGIGIISDYQENIHGEIIYTVTTGYPCPLTVIILESKIILVEKK